MSDVETGLKPEERISLLGDEWALTRSGKTTVDTYLDLVTAIRNDSSAEVISEAAAAVDTIDTQIAGSEEERDKLSAWVRENFVPAYNELGPPRATDTSGKRELRAELLALIADQGKDPEAVADAKSITNQNLADPTSIDQTLANAALNVAARNGDEALFNELQKNSEEAVNAQVRATALRALALFRDPALEKRALEYAVSGKVRNQDAAGFLSVELRNRDTQDVAWQFIQDNWDKVAAQLTTFGGGSLIGGTGGFCSADRIEQVSTFFSTHKVAASERALARAKNQINDCIDLRTQQESSLQSWLSKQ